MEKQTFTKCIFCDGKGATKEHVWPDWLSNVLPKMGESHTHLRHRYRIDDGNLFILGPEEEPRQGEIGSRKIRNVCNTCNTGWMSDFEELMKPALTPLIEGNTVILSREDQTNISLWIALRTVMAEFTDPSTIAISQEERFFLKNHECPPKNWMIWVGNFNADEKDKWNKYYIHHGGKFIKDISNPEIINPDDYSTNTQSSTFVIGQVIFYCLSAPIDVLDDLKLSDDLSEELFQIWPVNSESIDWSKTKKIGLESVHNISNSTLFRSFRDNNIPKGLRHVDDYLFDSQAHNTFIDIDGSGIMNVSDERRYKLLFQILKNLRFNMKRRRDIKPELPYIHVNWKNTSKVGSLTVKLFDKYFIGMNLGSFNFISLLLQKIMIHPENLIEIGDSSKENFSEESDKIPVSNYDELKCYFETYTLFDQAKIPVDPVRKGFVFAMLDLLMKIFVFKEYQLINGGHLDYLNDNQSVDNLTKLTLEYDRIYIMSNLYLTEFFQLAERYKKEAFGDNYEFLADPEKMIFIINYTFVLLNRLESTEDCNQNVDSLDKLPFQVKQMIFNNVLSDKVKKIEERSFDDNDILKMLARAKQEVHKSIVRISNIPEQEDQIKFVYSKSCFELIEKLRHNWGNVREELKPYAYGKLA